MSTTPGFAAAEHPRAGDGRFAVKPQAEVDVCLDLNTSPDVARATPPPRLSAEEYMVDIDGDDLREVRPGDLKPGMVVVKLQSFSTYTTGPRADGTGTGVQLLYGLPRGVEYPVVDTTEDSVTVRRPDGVEVVESFAGKTGASVLVKHSSLPT